MSFALGAAACSNDDDEPGDPVENEVEEEVENEGDEVEDELDEVEDELDEIEGEVEDELDG